MLLCKGWAELLSVYFDHTATFYEVELGQDDTGQPTNARKDEPVAGLIDVKCAVGDAKRAKTSNNMSSYGTNEGETAIVFPGCHDEIEVGWLVAIDGDTNNMYVVDNRTTNQSADVTEVYLNRWL